MIAFIPKPFSSSTGHITRLENYKTCVGLLGNHSRPVCFTLCLVSVYGHDLNVEMPSVQALASGDRSSLEMINKTAGLDITVWLGSSGGGSLG